MVVGDVVVGDVVVGDVVVGDVVVGDVVVGDVVVGDVVVGDVVVGDVVVGDIVVGEVVVCVAVVVGTSPKQPKTESLNEIIDDSFAPCISISKTLTFTIGGLMYAVSFASNFCKGK